MNLEQRVRLGVGYLEHLKERKPQYALALVYRYSYSDSVSEQAMKTFVRKLVTRLPRRARNSFGGLVGAERHTKVKLDGSYHFHFLLWGLDESMPDAFNWLTNQSRRAASELYPREAGPLCDCGVAARQGRPKSCRGGMSCRGPRMTRPSATKVQFIDRTPEKAYEYVTSDIYKLDTPEGGQFLDVGPNGVTGHLLKRNLL